MAERPTSPPPPVVVRRGDYDLSDLHLCLRAAREGAGLTGKELAAAVGISERQMRRIEAGIDRLTIARLEAWARACGVRLVVRGEVADG